MNRIKFLGTAGARFVVTRQLRKSGGIWFTIDDTNFIVDPGPGSLVGILSSKPKLEPRKLNAIILTHRHIDHSNDANILIEAMTNGGRTKKGLLFAPTDALDEDPVVLKHFRGHLEKIEKLKEGKEYNIENIHFKTPVKHIHGVETYGLNIYGENISISYVTDGKYFEGIEKHYKSDVLIINVVLKESKHYIQHFSINDAEKIIKENKPKLTILTHFGMNMIRAKPWEIAEKMSKKLRLNVVAANDGLNVDLDEKLKD